MAAPTKTCTKCGFFSDTPEQDFSPKASAADGLHPYCKGCKAAAQRETRRRNPGYDKEYYRQHPEKAIARVRVRRAVKQGRIKPARDFACSMTGCRHSAEHYHHLTYNDQAQIAPVCALCHAQIHSGDSSERDLTAVYVLDANNRWSTIFGSCEN